MKDTVILNKEKSCYIATIIGVIVLIASIALFVYDYQLEKRAVNITATITTIDYDKGKPQATVKYSVERETYRQKVDVLEDKEYNIGDGLDIKYDMNNPGKLIENEHYIIYLPLLVISILILLISVPKTKKILKKNSNIKYLKAKGLYLNGTIRDIIINNNGKKVKGVFPYKLRCKYFNPTDQQEYLFESVDTYINLNEIMMKYHNKEVLVYIDKQNTSNYYVDLDSLLPQAQLIDVAELMGEKKKNASSTDSTNEGATETKNEEKDNTETTENKE